MKTVCECCVLKLTFLSHAVLHPNVWPFIMQDDADGSNEYNNFQRGSLNTTKQFIQDLKNIDIVFHIGDICYANGYLSQWDQFTAQVEPIASAVPYMIARFVSF